ALEGGHDAWLAAKLPLVDKKTLDRIAPQSPSVWVTRRNPKIDRVACPWLIRRFIDPQARILFVDPARVSETAKEIGAIPFDIEGVELSHEGPRCSFDTMLKLFGLESDPHLARLALIVRGADTARPDLAPEAAGLHAISLGLSVLAGDDDHGLLRHGFLMYDALFAWLRHAANERHNWPAKAA
ncbi:MAG: chromate resistance protein, partial [Pseudolabrys sp.]|nr:chromate resistance protein [Pseudolabrys sp.]